MNDLEKKNIEFLSFREIINNVVKFRQLYFKEENPMESLYVMEVYEGGKVIPLKIDISPSFEKLLSKIKAPEEDKEERIKKMGIEIGRLNKILKDNGL